MIYTGLNRTGEIETVKVHGGYDVAEVYGGINEANPIYYKTRTITGQTPLSYKALSKPLSDYLISGNTVQDGTPAPDAPVDVVGCGEITANLFNVDAFATTAPKSKCAATATDGSLVISNATGDAFVGAAYTSGNILPAFLRPGAIKVQPSTTYVIKTKFPKCFYSFFDEDFVCLNDGVNQFVSTESIVTNTVITPANCRYVYLGFGYRFSDKETAGTYTFPSIIFNLSTAAKPYEPYGYKLHITVNGTEYPIYLGQVPTTRRIKKLVLTGEEEWVISPSWKQATTSVFYYRTADIIRVESPAMIFILSNKFEATTRDRLYSGDSDMIARTGVDAVTIRISDSIATTVEGLKSYLAAQYAAGTPATIWYVLANPTTGIVNEPLHKIGDYADTVSMAQTGVTIPTVAGANTLTVGTTVQPSEVSITGNIKEVST